MELFYSRDIDGSICRLDPDESIHCIKVLRHRSGDQINVIDGKGTLYKCRITSDRAKEVEAVIEESFENWGRHSYKLHMAVAPTKNIDRYEWFAEKATEIGFDELTPIIGNHSERKVIKEARIEKLLISAAKQSHKATIPALHPLTTVSDFIKNSSSAEGLKLIAYCFEDEDHPRKSIQEALSEYEGRDITIMIGPEGDFSTQEAKEAMAAGFIPVHLGESRLRTETAALTATTAVYLLK